MDKRLEIIFIDNIKQKLLWKEKIDVKDLFLKCIDNNEEKAKLFISELPNIEKDLKKDLKFYMESDPAADSEEEILIAYPGYKAIMYHRVAHELYKLGYKVQARIISEEVHFLTGIDIHPGAEIKSPFFIDHGTGIVIGETAQIGAYVKMYQGVTLGALSLAKGQLLRGTKRHPTIKDHVTIYSGVSILGGDVVVNENVVIGSNVFVLESIPANSRVTMVKPELQIITKKEKK